MLWLCTYFPQLGLEVCSASAKKKISPERPTVLLSDNRVTQRNQVARQRGIHIGTSLAAAHSIAADLVHIQRNPAWEEQRLTYLSEILYGFSSHVSIDSTPGGYLDDPDNVHHSVVLEISASLTLFGGLQKLLQSVYKQLQSLHHQAVLQVAHTPLAALCAARWRHQQADGQALPQVLPRVLPEDLDVLAKMPLECLALRPRQGESLHNMGLRNCGALLQLPSKELGQRFGKQLGQYLQRLTGTLPDPRVPIKPPQAFASGVHLLEACTSKTALLFPIKRLCHEFNQWLIAQQLGACVLRWEFANHADKAVTLDIRTTRPSQSGKLLLGLTRLKLERCELPRDVLDIRLHSVELEPWRNHSDSLFPHLKTPHFGEQNNIHNTPLTELLDQLRARLGPEVCSGVSVQHRHQPEQAWQIEPLQQVLPSKHRYRKHRNRKHGGGKKSTKAHGDLALESSEPTGAMGKYRPAWLLAEPSPVARHTLYLLYGPERLQGGWWQEQRMRRDYYIAQTRGQKKNGSYSWVFCESKRWYVHGYFG